MMIWWWYVAIGDHKSDDDDDGDSNDDGDDDDDGGDASDYNGDKLTLSTHPPQVGWVVLAWKRGLVLRFLEYIVASRGCCILWTTTSSHIYTVWTRNHPTTAAAVDALFTASFPGNLLDLQDKENMGEKLCLWQPCKNGSKYLFVCLRREGCLRAGRVGGVDCAQSHFSPISCIDPYVGLHFWLNIVF